MNQSISRKSVERTIINQLEKINPRVIPLVMQREHLGTAVYSPINTLDVLSMMFTETGLLPLSAQIQGTKKFQGYQEHMLMLTVPSCKFESGTTIPCIWYTNSHTAKSAHSLTVGMFRVICTNGLKEAVGENTQLRLRHSQAGKALFYDQIGSIMKGFSMIPERIDALKSIELTKDEKSIYSKHALKAITDDKKYNEMNVHERLSRERNLIEPRRHQDIGQDLFTVSNILQEHVTKGYDHIGENKAIKKGYMSFKKQRGIKAIKKDIKINQILSSLRDEMYDLKTGENLPS